MACDQWRSQIDTYLDGELPAESMRTLDAHLRTCPNCTADVLARVQFKRSVKMAGARFKPSSEFRDKVQKQIGKKRRWSWNLAWAFATATLAILLLASAVSNYFGKQGVREQQIYSELADLHVATLGSANPVDVLSSDRHTVKPWFQGKIPFTFNLPELQNTEFTLLGGRVAYLEHSSGAHLIYQVRKHEISVFIFPESAGSGSLSDSSSVHPEQTFNVESWRENGLRYIVFGDTGADDIQKLSSMLKSAGRA
jgi:anti-sigma factor RsiW